MNDVRLDGKMGEINSAFMTKLKMKNGENRNLVIFFHDEKKLLNMFRFLYKNDKCYLLYLVN